MICPFGWKPLWPFDEIMLSFDVLLLFEERSLYSLFPNMNPERICDFLKEIGMFHSIRGVLK